MARTPRVFDKIILYGERLTILEVMVGPSYEPSPFRVATCDDAGARIERRASSLWWDEDAGAWREVEFVDHAPDATFATEGVG